jgi:hypothetical protein
MFPYVFYLYSRIVGLSYWEVRISILFFDNFCVILVRPRCRWEDTIKMDLREVGWGDIDWIDMAQDRDRWWAVVNTVMPENIQKVEEYKSYKRKLKAFLIEQAFYSLDEFFKS